MRVLSGLLMILVFTGCSSDQAADETYARWRPLLAAELVRADITHPDDLYKFVFQGVMGPSHAVPDAAHARQWLDREWTVAKGQSPHQRPPLLLPLRPDGRLVRVDLVRLRQLVAGHGPEAEEAALETLAAAFSSTSQTWAHQSPELASLWTAVVQDKTLWQDRIAAIDLQHLTHEVETDWPAVHHSDHYRETRAPHYRVVDPNYLPAAWLEAGEGQ